MSNDLVYAADTWKAWSALSEGERKLRAAKAIQQGDRDDLWLLTLAYLQFKGRKGTSISAHTLRAYRRGVVDYLMYMGGADILRVSPDEAQIYVRVLEQGSEDVKPKSPATVQLRSVAARRFYQALQWCGFGLDNPFEKVMSSPTRSSRSRNAASTVWTPSKNLSTPATRMTIPSPRSPSY